jgi:hypothetical protein
MSIFKYGLNVLYILSILSIPVNSISSSVPTSSMYCYSAGCRTSSLGPMAQLNAPAASDLLKSSDEL